MGNEDIQEEIMRQILYPFTEVREILTGGRLYPIVPCNNPRSNLKFICCLDNEMVSRCKPYRMIYKRFCHPNRNH